MSKLDPKYYAPPFKLTIKVEKLKGAVVLNFFFFSKKKKTGKKWISCVASLKTCYLFIYAKPLDKVVEKSGNIFFNFFQFFFFFFPRLVLRSRRSFCG